MSKSIHTSLNQAELMNLMFNQSLSGIFVMMLDEPIDWDGSTDKEALLDYVFDHDRITQANETLIKQYGATLETMIGLTPKDFYPDNLPYGRSLFRQLFDQKTLHIDSIRRRLDGTHFNALGDYVCLFDEKGRISGHFGIQMDVTEKHEAEKMILESERNFKNLMEEAPYPILVVSAKNGKLLYGNQRTFEKIDFDHAEAVGSDMKELFLDSLTRQEFLAILRKEGSVSDFEMSLMNTQGQLFPAIVNAGRVEFNQEAAILVSINDISERKATELALHLEKEKYRLIATNTSDVIWLLDLKTERFSYISPSIEQLRGYTPEEAVNQSLQEALSPESYEIVKNIFYTKIPRFIANPELYSNYITEVQQPHKNGQLIWTEVSVRPRYNEKNEIELLGISRLIEERKRAEQEVKYLSYHDHLTGLFNRNFLDKRAIEEMVRSDRNYQPLTMLELDLDHFKVVNDTWGHPIGDIILRKTGEICNEMIRKSDVLVRMGGEEFIVLMPETDKEGAHAVAEKIRKALEEYRHPIVGQFTVSIGVAQRMHSESFISWYKRLDDALYEAKNSGRNCVRVAKDLLHQTFTTIDFEWGPEWLSGHSIIDAQHKALLDIVSNLISMTRSSLQFEKGMRELSASLDLVIEHFLYEETVLASLGYPDAEVHKAIHHNLIEQAMGFKASLVREDFETPVFLSFMIDTVIIGHILKEDTQFFPFLKNLPLDHKQA